MQDCRDAELVRRCARSTRRLISAAIASRLTRIQLGDAALAIDPISSSGVQKAMQTALSGAIVANTLLRRPGSTEAALGFYRAQLDDASERHRRWAAGHYREVAEHRDRSVLARSAPARPATEPRTASGDRRPRACRPRRSSCRASWHSSRRPACKAILSASPRRLHHPRLTSPLVFLGGRELAPLLQTVAARPHAAADRAILVEPHAARIRHGDRGLAGQRTASWSSSMARAERRHESRAAFGMAQARTTSNDFSASSRRTKSIWRRFGC